ncbi:DUF1707 SHOCT-like domain-containing protein [Nocardioides terrisoli]|uniref:DUF1707 SHOCT-like domain-containing protein n=1 Tax=Nocardioides terrisoli TaxID=3388267 RepID=UPI00287BAF2C|nr:DUF1707 domain-containing protein [Nocardioides marmorisolisilvae]
MAGPLEPLEPSQQRISDADRNRVAELLRVAAGDGRIDLTELDERLEATYAAKTYAELVPITGDLPTQSSGSTDPVPSGAAASSERHLAILGGFDRGGRWVVPAQMSVVAVMGGTQIDMRDAQFSAREVVVDLHVVMGGAEIVVNPGTNVVIEGTGIMGGFSGPTSRIPLELTADSPTVRVRGFAFWGGVSVARKHRR